MNSTAFGKREFRSSYLFKSIVKQILPIASCLFLFCFQSLSQNITLSLKKASLEKIFRQIEKQSPFRFVYSEETLQNTLPVSLNIDNGTIEQILTICFNNQPATYQINEHVVMVKAGVLKKEAVDTPSYHIVTGKVMNEQGQALFGATVGLKGHVQATATDERGIFKIKTSSYNGSLIISNVGYKTQEVAFKANSPVLVKLVNMVSKLDETIVIGYGTTTRRLNTGSVSRVTAEEIIRQPVSNPLAALEGQVPGLFITQGNGLPGTNFTVRLRGTNSIQNGNSPLYIIDGVPFLTDAEQLTQRSSINANSPFNSISTEDIESIELLKDADATAIYGSRGANGVILITTKKGSAGKTKVDFSSYTGWGKVTRALSYMNTSQYLQMRREALQNDNIIPTVNNAPDLLSWDTTRYVDWKKLLIGNIAHSENAHIRLTGGNNNTNFSFGTSYYRESTVFPGDLADKRTTVDVSVTHHSPDNKFYSTISASYGNDRSNLIGQDLTQNVGMPPDMYLPFDSAGKLRWSEGGVSYGNPLIDRT